MDQRMWLLAVAFLPLSHCTYYVSLSDWGSVQLISSNRANIVCSGLIYSSTSIDSSTVNNWSKNIHDIMDKDHIERYLFCFLLIQNIWNSYRFTLKIPRVSYFGTSEITTKWLRLPLFQHNVFLCKYFDLSLPFPPFFAMFTDTKLEFFDLWSSCHLRKDAKAS